MLHFQSMNQLSLSPYHRSLDHRSSGIDTHHRSSVIEDHRQVTVDGRRSPSSSMKEITRKSSYSPILNCDSNSNSCPSGHSDSSNSSPQPNQGRSSTSPLHNNHHTPVPPAQHPPSGFFIRDILSG